MKLIELNEQFCVRADDVVRMEVSECRRYVNVFLRSAPGLIAHISPKYKQAAWQRYDELRTEIDKAIA